MNVRPRMARIVTGTVACMAALAISCAVDDPVCMWQDEGRPEVLHVLGCPADHEALSGQPESAALPASRSVLFMIDRTDGNKIHFFDSERWRHFMYASEMLTGYTDLFAFNAEMYYQPGRRLLLGTLAHHLGPDVFAVEIVPIDKASPEMIAQMYQAVKDAIRFPCDLRYHPTSTALEMESRLPPGVPVVTTAELYEGATYQGMHLGETVGRVKRMRLEDLESTYVSRLDLVVLDRVPNDIPAVAGLVTGEFQTPLAHVNLLAEARGTPNMALSGAYDDPRFVEMDGQWARLLVRADGFSLSPSTASEADQFWAERRPKQTQFPALDLSLTDIIGLDDVDASMTAAVGGKSANFGELRNITPPLPVPGGFAIPCSWYVDFMKANGLDKEMSALMAQTKFKEDGLYRMQALASFRDRMRATPLDPGVESAILAAIDTHISGSWPIRFRSSSNVEDLEGFNGAGLYESASFKPGDPEKTLAHALKKVWASMFSTAAFEEREWARIDHGRCAMGVLVHRSFPDEIEAANGVAVTANPFDPPPMGQAAYYVNVQAGATSVTNPEPGVTPESFLYWKPPAGQGEMTYYSNSSLTGGDKVLSFDEIQELITALRAIHRHFESIYGNTQPYGMDVEFKFELPNRELVIKQARPYVF
ncbi:MAG TPA: PEP/pyruvate-binding domain-containing protein [Myxococcota bacterium]|nr:PEP/pyruvate-binding domain-containing protein [Myxococcota bacterium]